MKEQLFFFFLHAFAVFYDLVSIRNLFLSYSCFSHAHRLSLSLSLSLESTTYPEKPLIDSLV